MRSSASRWQTVLFRLYLTSWGVLTAVAFFGIWTTEVDSLATRLLWTSFLFGTGSLLTMSAVRIRADTPGPPPGHPS